MRTINIKDFQFIPKKNKIVTYSTSTCDACKINKENLKDVDLIYVECDDENLLLSMDIDIVPATFIYDENEKVIYKRYGTLFETQIKELTDRFARMIEKQNGWV